MSTLSTLPNDLGALLLRGVPAALELYRVAAGSGAIEEIVDAIGGVAKRARRLSMQGPLTEEQRTELRAEVCKEIRCVLKEIPEEALQELGEFAIEAIDAKIDTGPLEDIDGPLAKRGLAALIERVSDLLEPDPGNLEALAKRARREAERAQRQAERRERIAARKRAKG